MNYVLVLVILSTFTCSYFRVSNSQYNGTYVLRPSFVSSNYGHKLQVVLKIAGHRHVMFTEIYVYRSLQNDQISGFPALFTLERVINKINLHMGPNIFLSISMKTRSGLK